MASSGFELITSRRSTAKMLRRLVVVGGAVAAAVTSGLFFLGSSGTAGLSISTPPGLPSSGNVADVTTMTSSVTRTNGGALLQTGVTIAKINVAASYSAKIRVEIAWTNVNNAATLLNNPNSQISIGLYHAIHTGNCVGTSGGTTTAPLINLTDTDSNTYCVSLDQGSTGSPSVSSTGKLLLAKNIVAGNLNPVQDLSGAESACAANTLNDNDVPCQPASVTDSNQRALFVIASVTTPGTIPPGQQGSVGSLAFFVHVRRLG